MVVAANKCDIGHSEATNKVFAKDHFFLQFLLDFAEYEWKAVREEMTAKVRKSWKLVHQVSKIGFLKASLIILYCDP